MSCAFSSQSSYTKADTRLQITTESSIRVTDVRFLQCGLFASRECYQRNRKMICRPTESHMDYCEYPMLGELACGSLHMRRRVKLQSNRAIAYQRRLSIALFCSDCNPLRACVVVAVRHAVHGIMFKEICRFPSVIEALESTNRRSTCSCVNRCFVIVRHSDPFYFLSCLLTYDTSYTLRAY